MLNTSGPPAPGPSQNSLVLGISPFLGLLRACCSQQATLLELCPHVLHVSALRSPPPGSPSDFPDHLRPLSQTRSFLAPVTILRTSVGRHLFLPRRNKLHDAPSMVTCLGPLAQCGPLSQRELIKPRLLTLLRGHTGPLKQTRVRACTVAGK